MGKQPFRFCLQRHAETDYSFENAFHGSQPLNKKGLNKKGSQDAFNFGTWFAYRIIPVHAFYVGESPQHIETAECFIEGYNDLSPLSVAIHVDPRLNEPYISETFRKLMRRKGLETKLKRIHYFLTVPDRSGKSQTPQMLAANIASLIIEAEKKNKGKYTMGSGQIFGTTSCSVPETFLELACPGSFERIIVPKGVVQPLDGIKMKRHGNDYPLIIYDHELIIPKRKLEELANYHP